MIYITLVIYNYVVVRKMATSTHVCIYTYRSTLLCFDALSWLTMDHITRQRRTCLPVHLYVLAKLYKMFSLLNYSER